MGEWKEYKMGDVAEIVGGGTPSTDVPEYWNGEIAWITPRDLAKNNTRFISKGERNISINGLKSSSAKLLPKGTVLLSTRAPIGYLSIAINGVSTNQGFRSLIPNDKTTTNFLYYLLKNNVDYLISQGEGTTFGELAGGVLKSISFSFPPLPEQKSIASILSSLDDKIDLLHRQNKTLEEKAISDVIEVRDGTHDSPKPKETGHFLITSKHLKAEGIDFNNAYKISEDDYISINKRSKVNKDDILFSMIGTLGLIYYVQDEPDYAIKNIGLFKSSQQPKFAKFIYLLLKSPLGKKFIYESADGSTQEYISLGSLRDFTFKYPGNTIIKEFDKTASPFFEKIFSNNTQIRTLTHLRNTLLPKLMSGEVRVRVGGN